VISLFIFQYSTTSESNLIIQLNNFSLKVQILIQDPNFEFKHFFLKFKTWLISTTVSMLLEVTYYYRT